MKCNKDVKIPLQNISHRIHSGFGEKITFPKYIKFSKILNHKAINMEKNNKSDE